MTNNPGDGWNAGATYEDFMGRWSRPLAEEFIRCVDPAPGWHWLDVGTGTGALTAAICALASPASVVGVDPSPAFISCARAGLTDQRATFEVAGAGSLPRREGGYEAVVSGLALNFFPDPDKAMAEQLDVTRPGGLIGAFVWDYSEGMELLRYFWDSASAIDQKAAEMDEGRRFPICTPDSLKSLLMAAGADRIRGFSVSVPTVFPSFEDFWRPFLGGTGPAPSLVSTLADEKRSKLAEELVSRLPIQRDGTIELRARAWAVVGHRA